MGSFSHVEARVGIGEMLCTWHGVWTHVEAVVVRGSVGQVDRIG
jgi:hypothetical protein